MLPTIYTLLQFTQTLNPKYTRMFKKSQYTYSFIELISALPDLVPGRALKLVDSAIIRRQNKLRRSPLESAKFVMSADSSGFRGGLEPAIFSAPLKIKKK